MRALFTAIAFVSFLCLVPLSASAAADGASVCADTGGTWTDCGSGCGPATCDNPDAGAGGICPSVCTTMCQCPASAPLWDDALGCHGLEVCEGDKACKDDETYDAELEACCPSAIYSADCGPCPEGTAPQQTTDYDDKGCLLGYGCVCGEVESDPEADSTKCDDDVDAICDMEPPTCDEGLIVALQDGCYVCVDPDTCMPPAMDEAALCAATGGEMSDCLSGCAPFTCDNLPEDAEVCPEICGQGCACPDDAPLWDDAKGCYALSECEGAEPDPSDEAVLCAATGGEMSDCLSGCAPYNCDNLPEEVQVCPAVCVQGCACPADAPLWDPSTGCFSLSLCEPDGDPSTEPDPEGDLCAATGGQMGAIDDCAPFTCDNLPGEAEACMTEAKYGCQCPDDAPLWDADKGCFAVSECDADIPTVDPTELCEEYGGTWTECGSGCGPFTCDNPPPGPADAEEGIDCPAMCVAQCECPEETPIWDAEKGCITQSACGGSPGEGSGDANEGEGDGSGDAPIEGEGEGEGTVDASEEQELLCEATGGQMGTIDDCGPFTCDNLPREVADCTTEEKYGCQCPDNAPLWDAEVGCIAESACAGEGSVDEGEGSASDTNLPEADGVDEGGCQGGEGHPWVMGALLCLLAVVTRRRTSYTL